MNLSLGEGTPHFYSIERSIFNSPEVFCVFTGRAVIHRGRVLTVGSWVEQAGTSVEPGHLSLRPPSVSGHFPARVPGRRPGSQRPEHAQRVRSCAGQEPRLRLLTAVPGACGRCRHPALPGPTSGAGPS